MNDLRVQIHPLSIAGKVWWNHVGYRVARANGWHCGHWHSTLEAAVACVKVAHVRP